MRELKIFILNILDKIEDYIGYLIKLKNFLEKISDTMIGIQIDLSHKWKWSGEISDKTKDFI